jgi:hypothetical protein
MSPLVQVDYTSVRLAAIRCKKIGTPWIMQHHDLQNRLDAEDSVEAVIITSTPQT